MAQIAPPDATPGTFSLPARLDTDAAPDLRAALLARRGAALSVDAGAVTRLGGLCLTVLASAARSWDSDGHPWQITAPSEGFLTGCARLGLAPGAIGAGGNA